MEISISENQLIRKHNRLVESKHAQLSTMEKKLLAIAIAQIKNKDESFDLYKIPAYDIKKALNLASGDFYKQLKDIADRLYHRSFMIEVPGRSWEFFRFVDKARYEDGFFYIQLHRDLAPFLLNLYKDYTTYELKHVLTLSSGYSITIYEWLKKWSNLGKRDIALVELKERLGVQDNKSYENFKDFRRRVLEPALNEINEKSDITFCYETVKEKQKVVALIFNITIKEEKEIKTPTKKSSLEKKRVIQLDQEQKGVILEQPRNSDLFKHIKELVPTLLDPKITELVNNNTDEQILHAITIVEKYKKKNKQADLAGLFIESIKNSWTDYKTEQEETSKTKRLKAEQEEKRKRANEEEEKRRKEEESKRIWDEFLAMPEAERTLIVNQVLEAGNNFVNNEYRNKGVEGILVKANIITTIKKSRNITEI